MNNIMERRDVDFVFNGDRFIHRHKYLYPKAISPRLHQ